MANKREFNLHSGKGGAAITVRVTPRSSRNEISEILADGTVKIRLTAAPVDGKANENLVEYLAKVLDINKSSIDIVAGMTGREKLVTILGLSPEDVQTRILKNLA
ncbi:MAG: DUF167 domain-containing protein [Anaerolineaceae bacterium]|jgi:uncharacterized protein|nr:DUF167 domain-containing protein [Anaerolineaceae bacterium]